MKNQDEFERIVKTYLDRAGLSQAKAARQLHYTSDQFNKWLKGTNRIPDTAIQELANLLSLSREERIGLFELAGYVALSELDQRSKAALLSYLPPKTYAELVGREQELADIMARLGQPEAPVIVAVVGLGGIGKTALAYEVATLCRQTHLFEYVAWRSAKTEHFEGEHIIARGETFYTLAELLDDIGRQCDRLDITQLPPEQKLAAVKWLLAQTRVLIVLDNLETIPENDRLVGDLFQILGQSKLLITSRHQVKHEQAYRVELRGLPESQGVNLLRMEAQARNIENVITAGLPTLAQIHQTTGGAPLAMKLVVGQISRRPVEVVLADLKKASGRGPDDEFYRFVYWYSWDLLTETAQGVLVDMSVFPPLTGGAVADVAAISPVEPDLFWTAMDQLVTMSLVDKSGALGQERFALHPLTHYFILSDITEEWRETDEA